MDGIVERYGSGRAAVMAVNAGADMPLVLWQMKKKDEVYDALIAAVHSGEISKARLDQPGEAHPRSEIAPRYVLSAT